MIHSFFWILMSLSILYGGFLTWCTWGWLRLKPEDRKKSSNHQFSTSVSVIIPARNEETTIENCLRGMLSQNYPSSLLEIIVVNDHSTDNTKKITEKFIAGQSQYKILLIDMQDAQPGLLYKKKAITEAVNQSTGMLIITTDADCRHGSQWVPALVSHFEIHHPDMISAPVMFAGEKTIFEKFQSLEFMGLIGIGAAAIANHRPFLCNGANLAFTRKIFSDVNGYFSHHPVATGDDTQLLLKVAHTGKDKILFIKSRDATVSTTAKNSIFDFFNQRNRWASKITAQMGLSTIIIAIMTFLFNLGLLVSLPLLNDRHWAVFFLIPFLIKITSEFILLASTSAFFQKQRLLWLFLPAQLLHPFYIIVTGVASLFGTYEWKGRQSK